MKLDGYADAGVVVSVELVNELAAARDDRGPSERLLPALRKILEVEPRSVAQLTERDTVLFVGLAEILREVFRDLHGDDVDAAASRLNELLSKYPAHPHLAKEQGRWRVHHHPADVAAVPMWTSICAEAMARMIGAGLGDRFGLCESPDCERAYFDVSRNGSRRFCSITCQNRVKAAAFRRRLKGGDRRTRS